MDKKLQIYTKYFETAKDDTHLVMHRGYALALVKMVEEWKEKEFQACSLHHVFMDDIERLEKEIEQLKESAIEVINSKDIIIRRQQKEIEDLQKKDEKWVKVHQNLVSTYSNRIKDLRDAIKDSISIAEAQGEDFRLEPWNSLKDVLEGK